MYFLCATHLIDTALCLPGTAAVTRTGPVIVIVYHQNHKFIP